MSKTTKLVLRVTLKEGEEPVVRQMVPEDAHDSKEPEQLRAKHGSSLIRVHWQYAWPAPKGWRHVCTWANGDEGFVIEKGTE